MKARKLWIVAAAGLAIAGCGRDTLPVSGTGSGLGMGFSGWLLKRRRMA